ncbi:MAG: exodeoxyribonuclease VII large subunit [Clostridia bacterium]|nr:exodeoxyribonuclease VII large subunit [Clostridia bacterium]
MEQEILTVSVSQVNHYIHRVIEHNGYLKDICIKGEISNFKHHPSGHIYLTLKDDSSTLRAVMFRSAANSLRFLPEDGMKVSARGRISVYEPGGTYQLYIESMEPDGEGALYAAYEKLKKKLEEEGLFEPGTKKPIPRYPSAVCVITASSGAAIRDILNVLGRRYPQAVVHVLPVFVQGEGSAQQIADAIELANEKHLGDVIITGRGGGSIEDLWAFNEEIVARAIFASEVPVISAVGHETDFTIADFVADLRAPTPSAAAELAVPSAVELTQFLHGQSAKLLSEIRYLLQSRQRNLDILRKHSAFSGLPNSINEKRVTVDYLEKSASQAMSTCLERLSARLVASIGKLDALSPLSALSRGYSYAALSDGKSISSVGQLSPGTAFSLRVKDGSAECSVVSVKNS